MIIITGGAGFIGACLAAQLEQAGIGPLVICDWLGDAHKWRNIAKRSLYDIIRPEALLAYLESHKNAVEMLFHMGAISATTETDVDRIVANNFHLSRQLFNWCAQQGKRIVYASSAATYGDGSQGFVDGADLPHLQTLRPLNPYGWSKHAFDKYVAQKVAAQAALPAQYVGLKFFNVFGPNEYHKENQRSVVHQIFPIAAKGEAFALFKSHRPDVVDGGQLRDFIWVGDCTAVMLWLYRNRHVNGLFNVGTGTARSFLDLAAAVYHAVGKHPNLTFRPMPEALQNQYQYFTQANIGKLRAAGYAQPFTPLEEGIRLYVQDYLLQPDPYC